MESTRTLPQMQLSQVIPEDISFKLNDYVNSISTFRKILRVGRKAEVQAKFEEIAKELSITKLIVNHGEQKGFVMEEIEFADSSSLSKRKNKYAKKSNNHTAKGRMLN